MHRYFFDICDNKGSHRDEVGELFENFEEARDQCQSLLPDIVRDELPDGELHIVTCDVRDEAGVTVYQGKITFQGTRFQHGETLSGAMRSSHNGFYDPA